MNLDYWIGRAMMEYGGGFISALGKAFLHADPQNKQIMRNAWPSEFAHYLTIAQQLKLEDDKLP